MDIAQGAGLATATGVRPFLPPLLAGVLARGDLGLDFDRTGWRFLESIGFLLILLVLAVLSYGAERLAARPAGEESDEGERAVGEQSPPAEEEPRGRSLAARARSAVRLELAEAALGVVLGALLFAGSLAEGGEEAWPGLIAGAACAGLAVAALGPLLERARRRLDRGAAVLLVVYAEGLALALAAIAVLLPPLSFLALAGFVLLLLGGRRRGGRKYAGLRILR